MKQLNKVVKKILTTVNSCQPAVKLDPQNLLNYTTLLDTNTSDHSIFNLHTLYKVHAKNSELIFFNSLI